MTGDMTNTIKSGIENTMKISMKNVCKCSINNIIKLISMKCTRKKWYSIYYENVVCKI